MISKQGYESTWHHIEDELRVLDLKIQLQLTLKKSIDHDPSMEHLKGLVLFPEEIEQLFIENDETELKYAESMEIQHRITTLEQLILEKVETSRAENTFLGLPYLMSLYDLSTLEKMFIVALLASDLHRKYEKIFAFLQDDVTCKRPTVDLIMKLSGLSVEERHTMRDLLSAQGQLKKYLFAPDHHESSTPFMSHSYRLDERVIRFLVGSNQLDSRLESFTEVISPGQALEPLVIHQDIQEHLRAYVKSRHSLNSQDINNRNADLSRKKMFINIWGQEGSGKKLHVKHLCQFLGQNLLLVDVEKWLLQPTPFEQLLIALQRETSLQQAILCLSQFEKVDRQNLAESDERSHKSRQLWAALESFTGLVFILSEQQLKPVSLIKKHSYLDFPIPTPQETDRQKIWEVLLQPYTLDAQIDFGSLSSKFRFTFGQIKNACSTAIDRSSWQNRGETVPPTIQINDLHSACYLQIEHHLDQKATRINPRYTWDDLILPVEQKTELRNACNQIKYRHIVFGSWGFDQKLAYGKGLSLLFTGPPGTGKTMSAQIIAQELDLQIYTIELSQVISKYIGETEKNLQEIFTEAQYSHAILFFDEADALFGKRSEVKDSHDKHANVETSYLLQKMEEYEGISILASNYLQNIDEAFMRRINFIIKYPFPDQAHRLQIWNSLFPKTAPLDRDLDTSFLAEKLELTGGQIKNIVVSSAFLAAEQGVPIGMRQVWQAAKHEVQKTGKIFIGNDLEAYD